MSEETITDTQDSQETVPVVEGSEAAPAQADSAEALAAMEKRLHDAQSKITEMGQSNAELKGAVETLTAVAGKSPEAVVTPEQEDARLDKIAEEWELSKTAVIGIGNLMADREEAKAAAYQAELKALRDEGAKRDAMLQGFIETQDPIYQQNKDMVEKMVGEGLSRHDAMVAVKFMPTGPVVEAGSPSPGGLGNGTVAPDNSGNEQSSDDVVRDYLKVVPDATPEEIAAVRKKGVGLRNRDQWQMPGGEV